MLKVVKWTIIGLLVFVQVQAYESPFCNQAWGDAEYLYWKIQNSPESVPLVIQGPTLAVPPPVLAAPDTTVVLGDKEVSTDWRSGGKFNLGYWFEDNRSFGAEVSYFFLPKESRKYSVSSDGSPDSPYLLVPFYNVVTAAEDSTAIASSLLFFQGEATLRLANKMQGAEFNLFAAIPSCYCESDLIGLLGFRYWNFTEDLTFSTSSPYIPPNPLDTYETKDTFNVRNNFYGAQLGLIWEYDWNYLTITTKGKVALGAMCERLDIDGYLLTNDYYGYGAVIEYPGGYFALPTNIGKHTQTKFAAIPELNFDIGYQVVDNLQINVGYSIMYVSNVLWAGKQIDRNVNPTQATTYTNAVIPDLVGEASPRASLKTEGLWAQGVKVGLIFSF